MGELFLACSNSDFLNSKHIRQLFHGTQCCCNGCTCGRHHLSHGICDPHGKPGSCRNLCHSRCRNRNPSMLAPDISHSLIQGRNVHFFDSKIHKAGRRPYNIHNGIHGSHFVKMHLFQGLFVNLCLCSGYQQKHLFCQAAHLGIKGRTLQNLTDIPVASVFMAVVVLMFFVRMLMTVFMLSVRMLMPLFFMNVSFLVMPFMMMFMPFQTMLMTMPVAFQACIFQNYIKIKCSDPTFLGSSHGKRIASHLQCIQCFPKLFFSRSQIQQRSYGHISTDTRITFQI